VWHGVEEPPIGQRQRLRTGAINDHDGELDCVLVTELLRLGRSAMDLLSTLREFESWKVSVIAMSGTTFDISTPHDRLSLV